MGESPGNSLILCHSVALYSGYGQEHSLRLIYEPLLPYIHAYVQTYWQDVSISLMFLTTCRFVIRVGYNSYYTIGGMNEAKVIISPHKLQVMNAVIPYILHEYVKLNVGVEIGGNLIACHSSLGDNQICCPSKLGCAQRTT